MEFEREKLGKKYIRNDKLIGKIGTNDFLDFEVGYIKGSKEKVYDFGKYIEEKKLRMFSKIPNYPFIMHSSLTEIKKELGEELILVGYFVTNDSYVERVYDLEKALRAKGLIYVTDTIEELNLYNEESFFFEEDLKIFPEKIQYEIIKNGELYGFYFTINKIKRVFKTNTKNENIEEVENELYELNIKNINKFKKWLFKNRINPTKEFKDTIIELNENGNILINVKDDFWNKKRLKLLIEV